MKILFISREYPTAKFPSGGIGTYVAVLAPALADRGHNVHVLACDAEHPTLDEKVDGVTIHRRPLVRLRGLDLLSRLPETRDRLRLAATVHHWFGKTALKPDIIEAPEWMAEGLALTARRTPVVAHLHSPLELIAFHRGVARSLDIALASALERLSVTRSDVVLSPSRRLVTMLKSRGWMRRSRVELAPRPVDFDTWSAVPAAGTTEPTVLVVGRLEPLKGQDLVLEALALLKKEVPRVRAEFVGRVTAYHEGKPFGEWLAHRAKHLDIPLELAGEVPRELLTRYYARSRVVAIPSRFESFSMAALEAMAAARPIVYSTDSGVAEALAPDFNGSEIESGNALHLADALLPFLVDASHAAAVGDAGRAWVRKRCCPNEIAAKRELTYARIARQSSTPGEK